MNPLVPPDTHHLSSAVGWLELGNEVESRVELDLIAPEFRSHPQVLQVRYAIEQTAENWPACAELATMLVRAMPEDSFGWIHRSFALHELKRTQEALDELLPAAEKFPDQWVIRYNLACYACRLGNLTAAWGWLEKAMALGYVKEIKLMALADADLEALRTEIREI